MGVPKRLTEMQMKFAHEVVSNEGRKNGFECAVAAGYAEDSARVRASELQNPKLFPLVVKYIGELREEYQRKYAVSFERHISELAKIRMEALKKGAWSAAVNAEVARGKAAGLYIEQKIIRTGKLDDLSEDELEKRMKEIIDQYSPILEGTNVKEVKEKVKKKQKQLRLKGEAPLKNNKPQQKELRPLNKLNTFEKEEASNEESHLKDKELKENQPDKTENIKISHASNSTSSSSSHKTKE
jgi:phage terminase small subunit